MTNTLTHIEINTNKTKLFNLDTPCNKPPNDEFFNKPLLLLFKILLNDKIKILLDDKSNWITKSNQNNKIIRYPYYHLIKFIVILLT